MQTTEKHHKRDVKPKTKDKTLPSEKVAYSETIERLVKQFDHFEVRYLKCYKFKAGRHWRFDFYLLDKRILVEIEGGPWSSNRKKNRSYKVRKRRNIDDENINHWDEERLNAAVDMGYTVLMFANVDVMTNKAINMILDKIRG